MHEKLPDDVFTEHILKFFANKELMTVANVSTKWALLAATHYHARYKQFWLLKPLREYSTASSMNSSVRVLFRNTLIKDAHFPDLAQQVDKKIALLCEKPIVIKDGMYTEAMALFSFCENMCSFFTDVSIHRKKSRLTRDKEILKPFDENTYTLFPPNKKL